MTGLILAYLDPGSGSIIFQVVAVALMSFGVFFRYAIRETIGRVFGWVKSFKDADGRGSQ